MHRKSKSNSPSLPQLSLLWWLIANHFFNCKQAGWLTRGYLQRSARGRILCREAASPAQPLPHFGDAFAIASPFAASLLFGPAVNGRFLSRKGPFTQPEGTGLSKAQMWSCYQTLEPGRAMPWESLAHAMLLSDATPRAQHGSVRGRKHQGCRGKQTVLCFR